MTFKFSKKLVLSSSSRNCCQFEDFIWNMPARFTCNIPSGILFCHHLLQQSRTLEDHRNISSAGDMKWYLTHWHHQRLLTKCHMVQPTPTQGCHSKPLGMKQKNEISIILFIPSQWTSQCNLPSTKTSVLHGFFLQLKQKANLQKGGWGVLPVNHISQGVLIEAFDWLTCQTKRDVLSSWTFSHYSHTWW